MEQSAEYILGIQETKERFIREDGTSYTRDDIFVKLFVTFREKMLGVLKGPKLSVYLCVALHCGEAMTAWPSINTIAEETQYSEQSVKTALKELVDMGLVEVAARHNNNGAQTSNRYLIRGYISMGEGRGQSVYPPQVSQPYPPQEQQAYPPQGYEIPPKEEPLEEEPSEEDTREEETATPPPAKNPAPRPSKAPTGAARTTRRSVPKPSTKKGLSKEQEQVRNHLMHVFLDSTNLPGPTSYAQRRKVWFAPLEQIAEACGWDEDRAVALVRDAIGHMDKNGLGMKCPASILNAALTIKRRNGNAADGFEDAWREL